MSTTANKPLTLQEVFDRVWKAFVVEKRPASYNRAAKCCRYRGPGGEMCAIGMFIPDSKYRDSFENVAARDLPQELLGSLFCESAILAIGELQICHDSAARRDKGFRGFIEQNLRNLAQKHNLSIPEGSAA